MAEQHYPECERHRDGSPDCCICVRLEEHGYELLDNYFTDLRAKVEGLRERGNAHADDCPGRPGMRGICACDRDPLVSRAEVLALIDGAQ